MAEYPDKGLVAVSMQPDPPPPYPGVPYGLPSVPYGAPHSVPYYPPVSPQQQLPDSVHLVVPTAPPPRDYVLWSLVNAMFCNFYCLGFAALTFSIKSRDRLVMGDVASAHRYGISARRLNIAVLCVGIFTIAFLMLKVYLL